MIPQFVDLAELPDDALRLSGLQHRTATATTTHNHCEQCGERVRLLEHGCHTWISSLRLEMHGFATRGANSAICATTQATSAVEGNNSTDLGAANGVLQRCSGHPREAHRRASRPRRASRRRTRRAESGNPHGRTGRTHTPNQAGQSCRRDSDAKNPTRPRGVNRGRRGPPLQTSGRSFRSPSNQSPARD